MFWYFLYEKPSNGRERSNNIRQRYKLFNRLIFDQKKKRKKEKKKKEKKEKKPTNTSTAGPVQ